jgi:predicted transcriptional regulator
VSKGDNLLVSANGNNVFDPANTAKTIDFKRYGRDYYAYYQVDVDESTLFKNIEDKNLTDMFFDILNDDDKKYLYEPEEDEDDEDEDEEEEYNYLDDI